MVHNDEELPFISPDRDRYFEDYVEGSVYELGKIRINREEIVEYMSLIHI